MPLEQGLRPRIPAWIGGVVAALPTGRSLTVTEWARRHRAISRLVWVHVAVVPLYGLSQGEDPSHVVAEVAFIVALALGAGHRGFGAITRSVMATLGLVVSSAILTHFSGGLIEMHFHFFVMVAVISLYHSWVPFLVALGFVVAHHGIGGQIAPESVYNHVSAVRDAWRWALIHGGFILAESTACLVSWRLNEIALDNERSARKQMEKAHTDLAAAQALSNVGSWDWDAATGKVWWSQEMYRIVGRDRATFVPSVSSFLEHVTADDRDRVAALVEDAVHERVALDFECVVVRPDGTERIVHVRGSQAIADGHVTNLLGTCQDITERKALEAEVEHRAFHDALTGLPNRALFLDRLDHGLALSRRSDRSLSLLYVDLDDFKSVNDNLGHGIGDDLLVQVAQRIQDTVRSADTVARLGGDEFAVLLEDTAAERAVNVADRLLDALREPLDVRGTLVLSRASIGIAVANADDAPWDVLRHADIAMYAAKRDGKHSRRLFTDGMHSSLAARMELEAQLADAIESDQLVLHYQPLIDLKTNVLDGVEALVRWDHPERGLLPPSEFIPVAEETGLIVDLGAWVLSRATSDARALQDALGFPIYVSVNVAAPQLRGDLVHSVRSALADARLAPELLVLEITETCVMSQDESVVAKLAELRSMGVRIAIDDFGTGYSSLAYLRSLPVDQLKIDRAFVRDVADGPEGTAVVRSITQLGTTFGLRVIGEGIETTAQASALRQLGCHGGQGYLYLRPTDVDSLVGALSTGAFGPSSPVADAAEAARS